MGVSVRKRLVGRGVVGTAEGPYVAKKPAPCTVASDVNSTYSWPLNDVTDIGDDLRVTPVRVFTSDKDERRESL